MQNTVMDKGESTWNPDLSCKPSNPRCATPTIDSIMANWKRGASPYDDPAYQVPTCQREKIVPEQPKKQIGCATPFMDQVFKMEAGYDQPIVAGESETDIVEPPE